MADVRFELTTNDPWSVDDAICEGISPLGYWRKVNQSPTRTKPYNSTSPGKNAKEIIANSTGVENARKMCVCVFVCATIINELPVISCFFFFERRLPASMRPACLIYLSTSIALPTSSTQSHVTE